MSLAAPTAATSTPNPPSGDPHRLRTVGVLGGGQLGRMFVHTAQRMGYRVLVLDPDADAPAGRAADQLLRAAYDDPAALDQLGARCSAVTTEFENVPAASLQALARRCTVAPGADAVRICQHRRWKKRISIAAACLARRTRASRLTPTWPPCRRC